MRIVPWLAALALAGACDPGAGAPTAPAPEVSASAAPDASAAVSAPAAQPSSWDPGRGEMQHVKIRVTADGFVPKEVHLVQGRPATLELTREVESECVNAVRMPWMSKAVDLPLNETVAIQIPDMSQDGEFEYACWMNMAFGKVVIDKAPAPAPSSSKG